MKNADLINQSIEQTNRNEKVLRVKNPLRAKKKKNEWMNPHINCGIISKTFRNVGFSLSAESSASLCQNHDKYLDICGCFLEPFDIL